MRWRRPLSRVQRASDLARHFDPAWHVACMSTGQFALQLAAFPFRSAGGAAALKALGFALWCLNVVLFCAFTVLLLIRVTVLRGAAALVRDGSQSLSLAAMPMALATVVDGISQLLPGGFSESARSAAVVLWWLVVALSLAASCGLPYTMFTAHRHSLEGMSVVWAVPMLPGVVAASSGGTLALRCPPGGAAARDILLASYALCGLSRFLSVLVLAVYFQRLALHRLRPPAQVPGLFLPAGPLGMAALDFLLLGSATRVACPASGGGDGLAAGSPPAVEGVGLSLSGLAAVMDYGGTAAALLLWGAAAWWVLMAAAACALNWRSIPFSLGWWGAVFPFGTFTGATLQLAAKLGSQPFRGLGAALDVLAAQGRERVAACGKHGGWQRVRGVSELAVHRCGAHLSLERTGAPLQWQSGRKQHTCCVQPSASCWHLPSKTKGARWRLAVC
ncbi:hypothetical protein ABPG75_000498 [Micractinium tetrahymenae]